jgi:hypothetical protein
MPEAADVAAPVVEVVAAVVVEAQRQLPRLQRQ